MKTDETDERIALQPETETEQALLAELFTRLTNISQAPSHPSKVGDRLVHYTLDVPEYEGLNEDLWSDAECTVNSDGQLDPQAGSRALIVYPDGPPEPAQPTEDEINEAVEAVKEADDGGNAFTENAAEVVEDIEEAKPLPGVQYDELQDLAKRASTAGPMDIPANQSTDDLIEDLREYVEVAEVSL